MSSKKKQETHFNLNSPVITVSKESSALSTRSSNKSDKLIAIPRKPPLVFPNLLPYTPPDALMFALFSAIQRKAWTRARKLCYELILCDPLRQNYRDLHYRIDQIVKITDQRLRPQKLPSRATTASSGHTEDKTTNRR